MYIHSKSKSKETKFNSVINKNNTIKQSNTYIHENVNNIFTDYNYKYINGLKMEKIKQEIKDYIIDRYISIIMKQNKEINYLKSKIEKLLNKSKKLLKSFKYEGKKVSNFKNKKCNPKIYFSNSHDENNENIIIKNICDKAKMEKNRSNTNITYLKELNKKDMKKINYIHHKILSTKSFQDIFDDINSNTNNNFIDYANTLNLTNDSIESANSKKNDDTSFFSNLKIPKNSMNKLKIRISKNKELINKKLGKSSLNCLDQSINKKNIKTKNLKKKNSYFKLDDRFRILNNSSTYCTTENFYSQNKENDNCFSNINDINIDKLKRRTINGPQLNTYFSKKNVNI